MEKEELQTNKTIYCANCNAKLVGRNRHTKYCNVRCRVSFFRKKQRGNAPIKPGVAQEQEEFDPKKVLSKFEE